MTQTAPDLSRLRIDRSAPSSRGRRSLQVPLLLSIVALATAAAAVWWLRRGPAVEVQVAQVELRGGGTGRGAGLTANGYVVARTKASVASKIAGRLEYLGVAEGSEVRQGEIIARLESRDYAAAVAEANAGLARAQAALAEARAERDQLQRDEARARELQAQDLISAQEAETLTARLAGAQARVGVQNAQVQAARAALEAARANLENTNIRAPFNGTVLRKDAEVGEVVAPAVTGGGLTRGAVVTIADLETLEVEVDVNEAYIGRVQEGQAARVELNAYPDTTFSGRVRQIVPTADRQKATVLVKVSVLDKDPRILPEMGAKVEFTEDASGDGQAGPARVYIPAAAVRDRGGEQVVWIVRDERLVARPVDAGPVAGEWREVRRGLAGGEQVVVAGAGDLREGQRVKRVQASDAGD